MSIVRFLLPLVLVLTTCWAGDPIFEEVQPIVFDVIPPGYKLPNSGVKPINYEISLQPYFEDAPKGKEKFSFDGVVKITLKQDKPDEGLNDITLHAKNLNLSEVRVQYTNDTDQTKPKPEIIPTSINKDEAKEFITLAFDKGIPKSIGPYLLTIKYVGTLINEDLNGFYRSSYGEEDEKEWLATTQFEPVSARRAFPCWDEPAIKATFDIKITHPSDYNAISNMPEKKKEDTTTQDNDMKTTEFEQTRVMSTYLVAFVVSKFEPEQNEDENFAVWARPDAKDSTSFALERGPEILEKLEEYTNIKYYKPKGNEKSMNMPKMDQISIPQFWAGAMENWGLVTYRESALLYTENVTATSDMQDIRTVIAHELAHQWFGNLVTPEWWSYIWLNEGFATFFQYYIIDLIQSENTELSWRLMEQFVVKVMHESAFFTDATVNTRPMNQDAATPKQIESLFDNIAYKKAACVIRMLQHILTDDIFKDGLKRYLVDANNMYKTVTPEKLFEAMQTAAKNKKTPKLPNTIINIMNNWVKQPGYPVITVEKNDKTGEVVINQQRFFLSGPSKTDKSKWYIPLNYITETNYEINQTSATKWLEPTGKALHIKNLSPIDWVIFNNFQTGYYRVNYDKGNWLHLANYLETKNYNKIAPVSRAQLIDDALNLARAGYLPYDTALQITRYLNQETDYIPWYTAINALNILDRTLKSMSNYGIFQKYVAQKLQLYTRTVQLIDHPENSTHFFKLGRELMITTSCRYGVAECNTYTLNKLKEWFADKKKLPADLRDAILCGGVRQADQNTWNTTLAMYQNSSNLDEKAAIVNALGCTTNENIIQTFLTLSLEDNIDIDIFETLDTINRNNYDAFDILIDFIQNNFEKIQAKDKDLSKLTKFANQLGIRVTNNGHFGKLTFLVMRHQLQSFEGMATGMENLNWINKNQDVISVWLKKNYEEPKTDSATSFTAMTFLMALSVLMTRFY